MEETNNESIEKKLAYLNETKGLIKSAIINKGQELTDETPFRDYVQKINNIETGVDTSDATALASDILKGKTAYNAEGKIEGTLIPTEDLQEQLDTQDAIIQQLQYELANKTSGDGQLSYSELFALATSVYDTGIEDDSKTVNFTTADEMICLQRGLKILRGVV